MTLRPAVVAALLLFAGCESARSPSVPQAAQPAPAGVMGAMPLAEGCTGARDSLTLHADRGIGGTGVGREAGTLADRGIGGTGMDAGTIRGLPVAPSAERGGGGTGIVGVLTGFRSLCVNGVEVALDRQARVTVDGASRASETLWVGQVVAIEARGAANDLHAVSVDIRHEVSGPINAVAGTGDALDVADQHVLLSPQTLMAAGLQAGDWVAVSGLRDATGAIRASRLDRRAPGRVTVAGTPSLVDGEWRIGGLRLRPPGKLLPGGGRIVVNGDYAEGALRVAELSSDPLLPAQAAMRRMFVEGYPTVAGHEVRVAEGVAASVGPAFGPSPPANQLIVLELVSSPVNALTAVSWHAAGLADGSGHGKPPAPLAPTTPPPSIITPAVPTTTAPIASTTTSTTPPAATASSGASTGDSSGQSAAPSSGSSSHGDGGAADRGVSLGSGAAGGRPAIGQPPGVPSNSPPVSIGEGRKGPPSPVAPGRGGAAEGGSDGLAGGKIGGSVGTGTGSGSGAGTGSGRQGGVGAVPGSGVVNGGTVSPPGLGRNSVGKGSGGTGRSPGPPAHAANRG